MCDLALNLFRSFSSVMDTSEDGFLFLHEIAGIKHAPAHFVRSHSSSEISLQDLNEESQSVLILPLWFRLFVSECFRSFGEPEASLFRM